MLSFNGWASDSSADKFDTFFSTKLFQLRVGQFDHDKLYLAGWLATYQTPINKYLVNGVYYFFI